MRLILTTFLTLGMLGNGQVFGQVSTAVDDTSYVLAEMDYQNVGTHDCQQGVELPVRFIVKDAPIVVEYAILMIEEEKEINTVRVRKGVDVVSNIVVDSPTDGNQKEPVDKDYNSLPRKPSLKGYSLNLQATFCIMPLNTRFVSGNWNIWHENVGVSTAKGSEITSENVRTRLIKYGPSGKWSYTYFGDNFAEEFGTVFGFYLSKHDIDFALANLTNNAKSERYAPFFEVGVVAGPIVQQRLKEANND